MANISVPPYNTPVEGLRGLFSREWYRFHHVTGETVNTLSSDTSSLQGQINTIDGEITTINGEITTINGDITTINGDITTINGQISTINGELSQPSGQIVLGNGTSITSSSDFTAVAGVIDALNGYQWGGVKQLQLIATPPAHNNSAGTAGQVAYDSGFFYVCTAANTWARVAIGGAW